MTIKHKNRAFVWRIVVCPGVQLASINLSGSLSFVCGYTECQQGQQMFLLIQQEEYRVVLAVEFV